MQVTDLPDNDKIGGELGIDGNVRGIPARHNVAEDEGISNFSANTNVIGDKGRIFGH